MLPLAGHPQATALAVAAARPGRIEPGHADADPVHVADGGVDETLGIVEQVTQAVLLEKRPVVAQPLRVVAPSRTACLDQGADRLDRFLSVFLGTNPFHCPVAAPTFDEQRLVRSRHVLWLVSLARCARQLFLARRASAGSRGFQPPALGAGSSRGLKSPATG